MHAIRARVFAVLVVLLTALPLGAAGRDQYFCRVMGRVMDACCCAGTHTSVSSCSPEVKPDDCCRRLERGAGSSAAAVREGGALRVPSPAIAAAPAFAVVIPKPSDDAPRREPAQARAPPRTGPPLFLKNCSLLT